MKKQLQLAAMCLGLTVSTTAFSQRYLTEVFTSVNTTTNVVYGNNITVITGTPTASNLLMDVYEPAGDVETARPLVIVLHTGSFLPRVLNAQATGSRTDSAIVETCKRFARRGYVAVAATYRQGWNPNSSDQDVRTGTLLNAVYRAIQDAKNCVRFFRNDAATTNTFKIDVNRIAVGGFGTGGYISLAYATLNKVSEIQLNKFLNATTFAPYVDQAVSGNFDGTNVTALNNPTPSYAAYSSSVNVVFNVGGALGDSTWLEAGEVPIISMHPYKDPNAPFGFGAVIVPTTGDFVVNASGSLAVQHRAKRLGVNAIFENSILNDVYSTQANNSSNPGLKGLYPFITAAPGASLACGAQREQGAPWDWWDETTYSAQATAAGQSGPTMVCLARRENPDMSATKGKSYLDTIQGFINPRLVCALNLAGCQSSVGINENAKNISLSVFPNPATNDVNFAVTGQNIIQKVKIYTATGQLVRSFEGLNTQSYKANVQGLVSGLYFTTIELNNNNIITKKVTID